MVCFFFHLEILLVPSKVPADLPGQFSLSRQFFLHWAAATLKGLVEFQNEKTRPLFTIIFNSKMMVSWSGILVHLFQEFEAVITRSHHLGHIKGSLMSERFSLWLKSQKKGAKSQPWASSLRVVKVELFKKIGGFDSITFTFSKNSNYRIS